MRVKGFRVRAQDEVMLKDLYFAPFQKTSQLQIGNYDKFDSCRRQLYRLAQRELIEPYTPVPRLQIWKLTNWSWRRQAEAVGRLREPYRSWPTPEKAEHFVDTNDIYAAVSPHLDRILGKYPAWEWVDERRAIREYHTREGTKKHQPDAEIHFGEKVYYIERQTHRARKSFSNFDERCKRYRRYMDHLGEGTDENATLVFACDTQRDEDFVHKAAKNHGVPHFAGTLNEVIDHLKDEAETIVNHTREQAS